MINVIITVIFTDYRKNMHFSVTFDLKRGTIYMQERELTFKISSFGGCSISAYYQDEPDKIVSISESDGRTKKLWTLIEYLIFSGKSSVTGSELIDLLWPESSFDDGPTNPSGALRLLIHRARAELNKLSLCAGNDLILLKSKSYSWNRSAHTSIDTDEFTRLYKQSHSGTLSDRLECLMRAIALYKGRFLPDSHHAHWVMTLDAYYHSCYMTMCESAVSILQTFGNYQGIIDLCKRAVAIDPYFEQPHISLIEAMAALGLYKDAEKYYLDTAKMFMDEFGVSPSEEMVEAFNNIKDRVNSQQLAAMHVRNALLLNGEPGALYEDYPIFQALCQLKLREVTRSGQVMQLALVTIQNVVDYPSENNKGYHDLLDNIIRKSLRQGDFFTHLGARRYLVLLQSSTYENAVKVLERLHDKFISNVDNPLVDFSFSVFPFTAQYLAATEVF